MVGVDRGFVLCGLLSRSLFLLAFNFLNRLTIPGYNMD